MVHGKHVEGLSPRVRGNRASCVQYWWYWGSIPACAGEPSIGRRRCRATRVYPRVCGGTMRSSLEGRYSGGLSPRVRGNLRPTKSRPAASRSIPACAGEPITSPRQQNNLEVYPRVCGGTWPCSGSSRIGRGLSPRVRGNPCWPKPPCQTSRSIPACAGEPSGPVTESLRGAVYPRVCGGTLLPLRLLRLLLGLSPRVRGNRACSASSPWTRRSIPACAGEPELHQMIAGVPEVYPRVCGGTDLLPWM